MKPFTSLISVEELAARLDDCVVADCRHDLFKPAQGADDYAAGHIPGASFVSLDRDLAGPKGDGRSGRHPLPDPDLLRARLQSLGLSDGRQLVVYDADTGGFAGGLGGSPAGWGTKRSRFSMVASEPGARPATRSRQRCHPVRPPAPCRQGPRSQRGSPSRNCSTISQAANDW